MTNIFKVETENSVVHVTEEIPIGINKRKRKKVTRPPSTVLEEIEKENKMLGIDSSGQKGKRQHKSSKFFGNDFEVPDPHDSTFFRRHPQNNSSPININNEPNSQALPSDQSSQGGDQCNRFESIMNNDDGENNNIQSELVERENNEESREQPESRNLSPQKHQRGVQSKENSSKKEQRSSSQKNPDLLISYQEQLDSSEEGKGGDSRASQLAMDFFLQTQNDHPPPLLASLVNSNEKGKSQEKSPNEKSTVLRSGIKETELFGDIEYSPQAQRAHTDHDVSVNSGLDLLGPEQSKVIQKSPKMRKLFIQFSERKVLEMRKRKEKAPSLEKNQASQQHKDEEGCMCYQMLTSANIMEKPLETDVPKLENRITRQLQVKLVPNMQSGSTKSSFKSPQLNAIQGEHSKAAFQTQQVQPKKLNDTFNTSNCVEGAAANGVSRGMLNTIEQNNQESNSSVHSGNVPQQTGDEDCTLQLKEIAFNPHVPEKSSPFKDLQLTKTNSNPNEKLGKLLSKFREDRLKSNRFLLRGSSSCQVFTHPSNSCGNSFSSRQGAHFYIKKLKRLSPKPLPSLFSYQDEEDDQIVSIVNTKQWRDHQAGASRIRYNTQERLNDGNYQFTNRLQVELRYCTICNIDQPLRSKHCRNCQRCVSTYDHHCPWLGNCIGERNRKYFYWYLVSQELQLLVSLHYTVNLVVLDISKSAFYISQFIVGLFLLFVTYLLIFHSYLSMTNTTTWECLSWKKISYLKDWPRKLGSPFNIGLKNNLRLYCCYNLDKDNFFVWRMPKRRPDQESERQKAREKKNDEELGNQDIHIQIQ